jgi:hypothetical protein
MIPEKAGATDDEQARLVAPLMASYLHATINITDNAAGNGTVAQDQFGASSPNGLTIATLVQDTDIYDSLTGTAGGINFPIQNAVSIGGTPAAALVFSACAVSPGSTFKTWADVASATAPFDYLTTTGGGSEQRGQFLLGGYGFPAKMVTGYESATVVNDGCLRGDGKNSTIYQAEHDYTPQEFSSGKIVPLLTTGADSPSDPYYAALKNVPTLQSYVASNPPTTAIGKSAIAYLLALESNTSGLSPYFAAPPKTPQGRAVALQAALAHAYTDPTVQQKLVKAGVSTILLTAAQAAAVIQTELTQGPAASSLFKYGS